MINDIIKGTLLGGLLGGFCSWILVYFKGNAIPWNIFGYLWFCPLGSITIVLALSLYMSTRNISEGFLYNTFYGLFATIPVVIFTILLLKLKLNKFIIFILNIFVSIFVVFLYFKYKIYQLDRLFT